MLNERRAFDIFLSKSFFLHFIVAFPFRGRNSFAPWQAKFKAEGLISIMCISFSEKLSLASGLRLLWQIKNVKLSPEQAV